jgi:hypothetical protein
MLPLPLLLLAGTDAPHQLLQLLWRQLLHAWHEAACQLIKHHLVSKLQPAQHADGARKHVRRRGACDAHSHVCSSTAMYELVSLPCRLQHTPCLR